MPGKSTSIYQIARKTTSLTQERAAECLDTSVESIKAWEGGQRIPSVETVMRMVRVYHTPWLAAVHLMEVSQPLQVLPEIQVQTLPTAVIRLIDEVYDFAERHRDRQLLRIAEDGVIDDDERPQYEEIVRDLRRIISAAMQVIYPYEDKKRTAPMLAHRSGSVSGKSENSCWNYYTTTGDDCKTNSHREEGTA